MNGTYMNDEIKAKINAKMSAFEQAINDIETPDYLMTQMYKMYTMLIENGQFSHEVIDRPVITRRMIRSKRYIPNIFLDINEVDRVIVGNLYFNTNVCLMPASNLIKCMRSNRFGAVMNPEKFDLLPSSLVDYGTVQVVNSNIAVALARGSWINDWISLASQYEYVTLSL